MWCNFNEESIDKELSLARTIGVNSVRTFLQFSLVEDKQYAPSKCPSIKREELFRRLDRFLSIADSKGIKVILGLFDEAEYLPFIVGAGPNVALDHINSVLNYKSPSTGVLLANDPRIIMWDLVNELDDPAKQFPDGKPLIMRKDVTVTSNPVGMEWLKTLYKRVLKLTNADHFVTFGVLNVECAVYLIKNGFSERTMPQYHEYLAYNSEGFKEQIIRNTKYIQEHTGIDHVLIGETGAPSNLTDGHFVTWTEQKQNDYIATVLEASHNSDSIVGVMVCSLMNWNYEGFVREDADMYIGIYDSEGNPKPVVSTIRKYFTK
jgi:hypothetical protein